MPDEQITTSDDLIDFLTPAGYSLTGLIHHMYGHGDGT